MMPLNVASFYVNRREDYPDAVDYVPLLQALHRSCLRAGARHVVLTDYATAPEIEAAGIDAWQMDLPRNLMKALTLSQALCLAASNDGDTLFVGADCLVLRDFRDHLPPADLSIILRPGHKKHRINNGFMFIPAGSVAKVSPLFAEIAESCGEAMCDDMAAVERALSPMPADYGLVERAGITVNFLPMGIWNGGPKSADDPASESHVLHFRGRERKSVMLEWAARWLP